MANRYRLFSFRKFFGLIALLLAAGLSAQNSADPEPAPAADPIAGQAAASATPGADKRKINLVLIGYDIENNARAKKMLEDMAQAAQASGAKGQVLLAGKDNVVDLQQAMSQAVQIATGQIPGGGGGGGAGVMGIPSSGVPGWIFVILALLGVLLLLLAVLLLKRRRGTAPAGATPQVQASLDVRYPDGRRQVFPIAQPRIAIGRGEGNQLFIDDPAVSSRHAEITAGSEGFRIRDLGSANGTRVNGRAVDESELYLGDEIALGGVRITLGR